MSLFRLRFARNSKIDDGSELNCIKYGDETTTMISTDVHKMEKKLLIMWRKKEQASTRQFHISRGFVLVYLTIKIKCTHTNKQNWTSTLRRNLHWTVSVVNLKLFLICFNGGSLRHSDDLPSKSKPLLREEFCDEQLQIP